MASLVRRGFALSPILLIIVIIFGTVIAMAGDQTLRQVSILKSADKAELKYGKISFTLESGGNLLSRRDGFGYVSSYLGPGQPVIEVSHTSYDSFGGGAGIAVGYPINDKYSIEFSFQGASASSKRSSSLVSTFPTGIGQIFIVPVIDGQNFESNDQLLAFPGSHFRTTLDYESWYIDTFLGLDRTVLKNTNTELHAIAGLSYAHFEQDFEHEMTGTDTTTFLPISSDLDEDLRDNFFGLKGGLRLSRKVTRKIQVEGSLFGGTYYRKSKLDADQELSGVFAVSGGRVRDINASVNDRDSHFVPMTEGTLKVKYKINDRWSLAFSSGASAWWNMSKVNNPEPRSGNVDLFSGGNLIDEPVHIGNNDRLIDYHMGLAITFSH